MSNDRLVLTWSLYRPGLHDRLCLPVLAQRLALAAVVPPLQVSLLSIVNTQVSK